MAEVDRSRGARIEASFRAQYEGLDDDTLRQIASGSVPWVADGAYLFEARRAARAVLVARGAADIPKVPAWDPTAVEAPPWVRGLAFIIAVMVAATASAVFVSIAAPTEVDEAEACRDTRRALSASATARQIELVVDDCRVEPRAGGAVVVLDGCVAPGPAELLAAQQDTVLRALLSAFASGTTQGPAGQESGGAAPAPHDGREPRCATAVVADVVTVRGRPWFVRLR